MPITPYRLYVQAMETLAFQASRLMTPQIPMASGPEDEEDVPGVARRAEGGELSI